MLKYVLYRTFFIFIYNKNEIFRKIGGNVMNDETLQNEVDYLFEKYNNIVYDPDKFTIFLDDDKFLFGVLSPENDESHLSKEMQYKTLYDTLIDLDAKIKFSFDNALKCSYQRNLIDNFSIHKRGTSEETLAYYYVENALFRTSSLWDILAQLYCLFYNIKIPKNYIYYNKLFDTSNEPYYKRYSINEIDNFEEVKEKFDSIHNYIVEADNWQKSGEWEGNHDYVNKFRNKMIHRNSPNVPTMSDFDFNMKDEPRFMLKRIIEDYNRVSIYLKEIIDRVYEQHFSKFK